MRLSKIPVAISTAGRPEGPSVFALSTDIFGADGSIGVLAYGRTRSRHKGGARGVQGVLEGSQTSPRRLDSRRLRRASRFGACTRKPAIFAIWHNMTGNHRQAGGSRETTWRLAILSAQRASDESVRNFARPDGSRAKAACLQLLRHRLLFLPKNHEDGRAAARDEHNEGNDPSEPEHRDNWRTEHGKKRKYY